MELAPSSRGEAMLVDAMSHPISLVQALAAGDARWEEVGGPRIAARFSTRDPDAERMDVEVDVLDAAGARLVAMGVRLVSTAEQPRPAAYVVNGRRADRRIQLPGYEVTLADGARPVPHDVPLEDPMKLAVADFVRAVVEARLPVGERPGLWDDLRRVHEIAPRMRFLAGIVSAFRAQPGN